MVQRALPSALAQCSVMSAARMTSVGSVPANDRSTMPMLAVMRKSWPSMWNGSTRMANTRSATLMASSGRGRVLDKHYELVAAQPGH